MTRADPGPEARADAEAFPADQKSSTRIQSRVDEAGFRHTGTRGLASRIGDKHQLQERS